MSQVLFLDTTAITESGSDYEIALRKIHRRINVLSVFGLLKWRFSGLTPHRQPLQRMDLTKVLRKGDLHPLTPHFPWQLRPLIGPALWNVPRRDSHTQQLQLNTFKTAGLMVACSASSFLFLFLPLPASCHCLLYHRAFIITPIHSHLTFTSTPPYHLPIITLTSSLPSSTLSNTATTSIAPSFSGAKALHKHSTCIPSCSTTSQTHQHCFYHPSISLFQQLHLTRILVHTILTSPSCHPQLQSPLPIECLHPCLRRRRHHHPRNDNGSLLPVKLLPGPPSTIMVTLTCTCHRPEPQQ